MNFILSNDDEVLKKKFFLHLSFSTMIHLNYASNMVLNILMKSDEVFFFWKLLIMNK